MFRVVSNQRKKPISPLLSCHVHTECIVAVRGRRGLLCAHPRVVVLRQRRRAPRRRRRGARRESSKTRRVSVVVLRSFYEQQHSRVSHFQRDMSRVFHVLEDSSCAHGMCSNFRGGCWTLRTATPPLRGGCYASAQQTRPPGGSLRAATQPLKGVAVSPCSNPGCWTQRRGAAGKVHGMYVRINTDVETASPCPPPAPPPTR